jgi:hypothetical protein
VIYAVAVALILAVTANAFALFEVTRLDRLRNEDQARYERQRAEADRTEQERIAAAITVVGVHAQAVLTVLDERYQAQRITDTEAWKAAIVAAIAEAKLPPAPPALELEQQERVALQIRWREGTATLAAQGFPTEVCPDCFLMHGGICPRVAEISTERKGTTLITTKKYWPNDQWAPPAEAMSGTAIFGGNPPQPEQGEESGISDEDQATG